MLIINSETFQSSISRCPKQLSFIKVFMIRPKNWSKLSYKSEGPNLRTELVGTVWGIIWPS